jgi:hypothetical protein
MTEKEFFEKLKAEGLKGNYYAFKELFNIDNQGNIISSKEGVWFDLRFGDAPFIFPTNIPRAELEKFAPKPSADESFFNKLKSNDKPSPFTSKGYPFSKDWSSYDSTSLGRAFFSDGIVDGISCLKVYDHISMFDKLGLYLKNEPYFFKKKEISVFVYTADNQEEIKDKYNRLSLISDELGIFALKKSNSVDFKVKMSISLFETSRFKTTTEMERFTKTITNDELKDKDVSSKWLIDLFEEDEKQLLDPLNVYTKDDFQKYENPAISTFVKKDFYKNFRRPTMKMKTVDVTLGLFFDGTGNNRYNTELIYNQYLDKDLKLKTEEIEKLFKKKNAIIKHPVTNKNVEVEEYMVNLNDNTSYLNPYSNIVLLHDLYQSNSDKFNKHTTLNQNVVFKHYVQGIGTKVDLDQNGIPIEYYKDDIFGSATGRKERGIIGRVEQGIHDSVLQLKRFLEEYNREIRILTIDVFGFSRGATAARHFIYEVLRPEVKEHQRYALNQQGKTEYTTIPAQPRSGLLGAEFKKQGLTIPPQIDIRFTGLYDTVVTDFFTDKVEVNNKKSPEKFEIPVKIEQGNFIKVVNTTLKNLKSRVVHIIAMDEYRENFPLTVSDAPNTTNLYLYGSHSDIGGGYAKTDYNTIIGFKDIRNKKELIEYEKIADSYRRRYAFQKNAKGIWEFKKGQISLVNIKEHRTNPRNEFEIPKKESDHYIILDKRFISNKLQLVSLNAMLQYALTEKVPFQSDFKKVKNINQHFYEVPKSVKYFMNYYDGIMKIVKSSKDDKLNLAIEDYYPLYQNYVHISSNYNKASGIGVKGLEAPEILYVNHPTDNKKRKYLKPTEELDYKR